MTNDIPSSLVKAGYQQIYIVKQKNVTSSTTPGLHETFSQCGRWCYDGFLPFDVLSRRMTLQDIPRIIPALQRQQDDLAFLCEATRYVRA